MFVFLRKNKIEFNYNLRYNLRIFENFFINNEIF